MRDKDDYTRVAIKRDTADILSWISDATGKFMFRIVDDLVRAEKEKILNETINRDSKTDKIKR